MPSRVFRKGSKRVYYRGRGKWSKKSARLDRKRRARTKLTGKRLKNYPQTGDARRR